MNIVLISDAIPEKIIRIFDQNQIEAHYKPDITQEQLANTIKDYDALVVRSRTKVKHNIIQNARKLKVIGRAGIGVDNIDVNAATNAGIVVMNTPYGNSITTAEHTIAMMMAVARQIPQANQSTKKGKWEKNKFLGTEIFNKNIGIIGCGNIGTIVAKRALGLQMNVFVYDPFLSNEKAAHIGVTKTDLHELIEISDFITIHTPLTDKTRNIINKDNIKLCKKNAYIINCARGGLVEEKALLEAIDNKQIAGAALDVFENEPAKNNPLFDKENIICTPHLGAATAEAQNKVAQQIANQISQYLKKGAIENSVNSKNISAKQISEIKPFINLAKLMGEFCGQIIRSSIKKIEISFHGKISKLDTTIITNTALCAILAPILQDVNNINARKIAKQRHIQIEEKFNDDAGIYETYMLINITTEKQTRKIAGTIFSDKMPRIINVDNVNMEAVFAANLIYIVNVDEPGFIGALGMLLGNANINIARFNLGRKKDRKEAVALVEIDEKISEFYLEKIRQLEYVKRAEYLHFPSYKN